MVLISLGSEESADILVLRSMDSQAAAASEDVLIQLQVPCLMALLGSLLL